MRSEETNERCSLVRNVPFIFRLGVKTSEHQKETTHNSEHLLVPLLLRALRQTSYKNTTSNFETIFQTIQIGFETIVMRLVRF